jgi:hypothetical protein
MTAYPPGKRPEKLSAKQQVEDAEFLTREFGMNTRQASDLVAREGVPAEELKEEISAGDGTPILPDPVENVPTPSAPNNDLVKDTDEQARKPVIHRQPNPRGAG